MNPKQKEDNQTRRRRPSAFFSWFCCFGLFFLYGAVITTVVLIPTLISRASIRQEVDGGQVILSQTLTQINNNQIRISVILKNNVINSDFNVSSLTNTLLGGVEMTCLPPIPTILSSSGGMLMCTNIYEIQPTDGLLNSTLSVNNGEIDNTEQITVVVFPTEICNRTSTQYGQDIIQPFNGAVDDYSTAISADGSVIAFPMFVPFDQGIPQIYEFDGTNWIPKGDQNTLTVDMVPLNNLKLISASLSDDGNTAALAVIAENAPKNRALIYVKDFVGGVWVQRGQTFIAPDENFSIPSMGGTAFIKNQVAISPNGNTIALSFDTDLLNTITNASTSVYDWNGSTWVIRGEPQSIAQYDEAEISLITETWEIDISGDTDTYVVTFGSIRSGTGPLPPPNANAFTFVFQWNGTAWNQRGQVINYTVTIDDVVDTSFTNPGISAEISTDGNTIFNGIVYDWSELDQLWIARPLSNNVVLPELSALERSDTCMSYDGRFVAARNRTFFFSIHEWKPLQQEWVVCSDSIAGIGFFNECPFSRDGMHYLTFGRQFATGQVVLETFTFLE